MKLGKEEIQKIFLSILLLIGLLYCYFNMLLGPMETQEENAQKTIGELTPKIAQANADIKEAKVLETKLPEINEKIEKIKSLIPDGAPIAWFPPRITEFFKRQGIEKCAVHIGGETLDKDLTGFKKLGWNIEIPKVEITSLGIALAALEDEQPLLEVNSLQISELKEDVQFQSASITVTILIKQ